MSEKGYLIPARRDPKSGRLQWAVPGIVDDLVGAVTLPGDVYRGEVDPLGDEAQRRAMDLAGMAVLGTVGRAGSSMLAAKGPVEYDAPRYPQRPFLADYPGEVPADATGKLQRDIEGRPLTARYVAGRTEAMQRFDRPAGGRDELAGMVEALVGQPPRTGPRSEIGGHGGTFLNASGRPTAVALADDLHSDDIPRVLAHELGHVIDVKTGPIPTDGLRHELAPIYHAQATGQRWSSQPITPQVIGYSDADAPQEYMAEAIRNYLLDPNSIKSVAPETAARIRAYVNSHPEVSKTIQFNTAAPLVVGGGLGAAALAPTEAQGNSMANWWDAAPVVDPSTMTSERTNAAAQARRRSAEPARIRRRLRVLCLTVPWLVARHRRLRPASSWEARRHLRRMAGGNPHRSSMTLSSDRLPRAIAPRSARSIRSRSDWLMRSAPASIGRPTVFCPAGKAVPTKICWRSTVVSSSPRKIRTPDRI